MKLGDYCKWLEKNFSNEIMIPTLPVIIRLDGNNFYIDNEIEYLTIAWLFGIKTYHYKNNKIINFSLKSK